MKARPSVELLTYFTGILLMVVTCAPTLMLSLGILHDEWSAIPPFGFWECAALVTAFRMLLPVSLKSSK